MEFVNNSDHFDQHFLVDNSVIHKFIDISELDQNDIVVEIGPGKGIITDMIAKKVKKLYCIELDLRLKPYLVEVCKKNKNVEVIYSSVLNVEIPRCNKIITSLPYSIIEPFMSKMVKTDFSDLIMITGSKFANSVQKNEINKLSLLTNCFFDLNKIMDISPECFNPAPRTISSMVKLKHKQSNIDGLHLFFQNMYLLDHKKIKNGMIESLIITKYCSTQREAREIIKSLNITDEILETKFEVCSNEQLIVLYSEVCKLYNE